MGRPVPTPITTQFGFRSTAAEVVAGIDLTGQRAIVTGASSGIGIETARTLAGAGAGRPPGAKRVGCGRSASSVRTAQCRQGGSGLSSLVTTSPSH